MPNAQKERPTWIVINGEVGNKRYKKKRNNNSRICVYVAELNN